MSQMRWDDDDDTICEEPIFCFQYDTTYTIVRTSSSPVSYTLQSTLSTTSQPSLPTQG